MAEMLPATPVPGLIVENISQRLVRCQDHYSFRSWVRIRTQFEPPILKAEKIELLESRSPIA